MKFSTVSVDGRVLDGIVLVDKQPISDHRGEFSRIWCNEEFQELLPAPVQVSTVTTKRAGTIRGLHFQSSPHAEAKYIRCLKGLALVAVVDIRRNSPTHLRHFTIKLSCESGTGIFVAPGFAQGYQTLADDTEMIYFMSAAYHADSAAGYRYDDPAFGITWPMKPTELSDRDRQWEAYRAT